MQVEDKIHKFIPQMILHYIFICILYMWMKYESKKIIIKIHKFWEKILIHILKQCFIFKKYKKLTVHTYDKKKQCILNNDYHKAYQIIPQKTASKLYKKPATKSYKNLLQNYTKTCYKIIQKPATKFSETKCFYYNFIAIT